MSPQFGHEKLKVYQEALKLSAEINQALEGFPTSQPERNQLQRASLSIPLNIAEGNGKFTPKDKCRFLDIARGSAMECAACLDVLKVKGLLSNAKAEDMKQRLCSIVRMLVGLIRSISKDRDY